MKWIRNIPESVIEGLKITNLWKDSYVIGDPKKTSVIEVKVLKQEGLVGIYEKSFGEDLED